MWKKQLVTWKHANIFNVGLWSRAFSISDRKMTFLTNDIFKNSSDAVNQFDGDVCSSGYTESITVALAFHAEDSSELFLVISLAIINYMSGASPSPR